MSMFRGVVITSWIWWRVLNLWNGSGHCYLFGEMVGGLPSLRYSLLIACFSWRFEVFCEYFWGCKVDILLWLPFVLFFFLFDRFQLNGVSFTILKILANWLVLVTLFFLYELCIYHPVVTDWTHPVPSTGIIAIFHIGFHFFPGL